MIELICLLILLFYAFIIGFAILGWHRTKKDEKETKYQDFSYPFCSVVIAARNEEQNIERTVQSLLTQHYPADCFEIIVVDDHSTDNTFNKLQSIANNNPQLIIISAPDECRGKKQALQCGLNRAQGALLLLTDADCILNEHWIESYVAFSQKKQGNLFFGNVVPNITKKSSLLEKCFALDFIGIVSVQNGLAQNGHPFCCNGANMCITKQFFEKSYETNSNFSSGDDVFLLHKAKKIDQSKIYFVDDPNATIETAMPSTIQTFIQQRCRWASKSSGYKDFESIFIAVIVYLLCFSLCGSLLLLLFNNESATNLFCRLLIYKTVLDFFLFLQTMQEFKSKSYILLALPLQLFYFIYITLIPFISTFKKTEWKGRKIQ